MYKYPPPTGYRLPSQPFSRFGYDGGLWIPGIIGKSKALLGGPNSSISLAEVSTRTALASTVFSPNLLQYNIWTGQVAKSPISAIKVAYANWAVVNGVETPTGGVMTVTGAIEFPLGGAITQLTFNGGAIGTIPDGLEGVTDLVSLPRIIPTMSGSPSLIFSSSAHTVIRSSGSWLFDGFRIGDTVAGTGTTNNNNALGAITNLTDTVMTFASGLTNETVNGAICGHYRLRQWWHNTVGMCFCTFGPFPSAAMGDMGNQSATDSTLAANLVAGSFPNMWPSRIIGTNNLANDVCLVEDSRGVGSGEDPADNSQNRGQSARSLSSKHALFRLLQAGATVSAFVGGHVRQSRLVALAPPTNVLIVLGINDLTVSSAAQIEANIILACTLFPTSKVYVGTVAPKTTSLDLWATTANQTVTAFQAQLVALNTWIRALTTSIIPNFAGFLEIANFQETAQNSGIWKVTGSTGQAAFTTDGLHATSIGDNLVSVAIP